MRLFLTQNFSQLTLVNGIRRSGIGRDLLVSSHAGTRLPIAVIQSTGRSPSARRSFMRINVSHPFSKKLAAQKKRPHNGVSSKNPSISYGGIIRIRFFGSWTASIPNLSRLSAPAPRLSVQFIIGIIALDRERCKRIRMLE